MADERRRRVHGLCVTAQEMIPEAVGQDEPAGVISVVLGFALMMALDIAL